MRYLRLLIGSFIFLFLVVFGISLFIPSNVRISRAINMKAGPEAVWKQVDDMRRWPTWNPFFAGVDPSAIIELDTTGNQLRAMRVNGTDISWQQSGKNERIAAMNRPGRKPVLNGWKSMQIAGSDSTTVQWYMDFKLSWYPWEKFSSLLFERSYGSQMELGLTNLKKIAESDLSSIN